MYNTNFGGYQFPQLTPQQYQPPQQQPSQPKIIVAYINGIEEAKGFILASNTIAFLIDTQSPTMFRKITDETGVATLKEFEIIEKTETPPVEYVTKTEYQTLLDKFEKLEKGTIKPIVPPKQTIRGTEYEQQSFIE